MSKLDLTKPLQFRDPLLGKVIRIIEIPELPRMLLVAEYPCMQVSWDWIYPDGRIRKNEDNEYDVINTPFLLPITRGIYETRNGLIAEVRCVDAQGTYPLRGDIRFSKFAYGGCKWTAEGRVDGMGNSDNPEDLFKRIGNFLGERG